MNLFGVRKTLMERAEILRQAATDEERAEAAHLLAAQTAMGDGDVEEKVIRLMVWVAAVLPHGEKHTLLDHHFEILESRTAWCDQNARILVWFCRELLDLRGRILELKHTDGVSGHTVCEIFYLDHWHLFDADSRHVACYREVIFSSLLQATRSAVLDFSRLCEKLNVVENRQHWWRGANGEGMEGFFVHSAKISEEWVERRARQ